MRRHRRGQRVGYSETPWLGGYAEYNRVPVGEAVPIPARIDDQVACAAMLQGLTAQYLCSSTHDVGPSDVVLVHAAAGGVGRLLVQLAKARGATASRAVRQSGERDARRRSVLTCCSFDYRARPDFAVPRNAATDRRRDGASPSSRVAVADLGEVRISSRVLGFVADLARALRSYRATGSAGRHRNASRA